MSVIVIGPNGPEFSPIIQEDQVVYTQTSGTGNAPGLPPVGTSSPNPNPITTAPNTQPYPTISPNIGINPSPNIGIGYNPYSPNQPQITDPKEWDEVIRKLIDPSYQQGLSEKERVFEMLCQYVPDSFVREHWYGTEEANKNPIESGMNFLAKYLLTTNQINVIL